MPVPASSAGFPDVLDPRFKEISYSEFRRQEDYVPMIYDVQTSDRDSERISDIGPMGDFQEFTGTLNYDAPDQGYDALATHKVFTLGIQIKRELYDDDQFNIIDSFFREIGSSAFKTRQKHAARIFNQAFSNDTFFYSHTEGVPLCSNSHTTTRSGVSTTSGFDNLVTAALSGTALTAAVIQFRQFKDLAGEPVDETPDELWLPVDLRDRAAEILRTKVGLDTAEGNINVHEGAFKAYDWVRMSDTNNWFLTNSRLRGIWLKWYERIPFETAKMEAFDQIIAKARGYMRYSTVRGSWQWILGAQVS